MTDLLHQRIGRTDRAVNTTDDRPDEPQPSLQYRGPERRGRRHATRGRDRDGGRKVGFGEDFRRFFVRGLSALLPTLITLWLLIWVWEFLWENLGQHMISAIVWVWNLLVERELMPFRPAVYTRWYWWTAMPNWLVQLIGVTLSVLLVYLVGLLVGNLIGRTIWRLAEMAVMRIPLVRAIYPAVKQVTDFVLAERAVKFEGSRVVAVQRDARNVWSIGLVTGAGVQGLTDPAGREMVTVFIPSTPTSFSGYVVVVPRESVVELPLKVEEAMRLLVSGGVIAPGTAVLPGPPGAAPTAASAPQRGALPELATPASPKPAAPELLPDGVPAAGVTLLND